jgi:proprotein convertase subtilisin/kexin type 5
VICSGCLTCSGTTTTCTSCSGSKYLYNSQCVDTCPEGSYSSGNDCYSCLSTCVTCSSSGSCITCQNNYYKFGSLCLSSCPSGYCTCR